MSPTADRSTKAWFVDSYRSQTGSPRTLCTYLNVIFTGGIEINNKFGKTYQSLTKKIKRTIGFGSIIGKNVFYKTIAHKNTTSLKNNHKLSRCSHYHVQTS